MKTIEEMGELRRQISRMISERRRFERLKAKPSSKRAVVANRAELDFRIEIVKKLANEL